MTEFSNCSPMSSFNLCYLLEETPQCQNCFSEGDSAYCDGQQVLYCQMTPDYLSTSVPADLPWMTMSSQDNDVIVGQNVTFVSNKQFQVSQFTPFSDNTVSNFIFTTSAATTNLNWTWASPSEYMYFMYLNMSATPIPITPPTLHPTYAPYDDDDDDAICDDSPCPTHCANGYTSGYTYQGCTVYCKSAPTNGQCLPGGSGCTSSCRDISVGAIIGIVVGVVAFCIIVGVFLCYRFCKPKPAMATQTGSEMAARPDL